MPEDAPVVEFDLSDSPPEPEVVAPAPLTEAAVQAMMDAQADKLAAIYAPQVQVEAAPEIPPENAYQLGLATQNEIEGVFSDIRALYADIPDRLLAPVKAEMAKLSDLDQLRAFRAAGYHTVLAESAVLKAMSDPTAPYVPARLQTQLSTNESTRQAVPPQQRAPQVAPAVIEDAQYKVAEGHISKAEAEDTLKFLAGRK